MSIDGSTTYSKFNNYILKSVADAATTNNQKNNVWFHFSRKSLLTLIDKRDSLIYDYGILGIVKGESSRGKLYLSAYQLSVYDAIALAKSSWSDHQA